MFRSIQYKLVTIFGLLVLSIITVIGSLLLVNIINFYNSEFTVMMEQVFTDEFVASLEESSNSEEGLSLLSDTVRSYIGPLGIDTYRFYCILDAKNASVLASSDSVKSSGLTKTDNIIIAMTGKRGNMTNARNSYMDYAVPLDGRDGTPKYIVYIKDTKDELQSITRNMSLIVLQALLIGSVIAIIIGYLLSRTITIPIINLTKRAERVASGEFDTMPLSKSNDEIGRLSNTFQYMSTALHETIDE
ncbi:MAG: HAMP domain-containing protein, partial [Acutalibacteraceae bacterium]